MADLMASEDLSFKGQHISVNQIHRLAPKFFVVGGGDGGGGQAV